MDTSEQYIKMCEKAEEIQALKPRKMVFVAWRNKEALDDEDAFDGDWVVEHDYSLQNGGFVGELEKKAMRVCVSCLGEYGSYLDPNCVWLPRQDQLQEMVEYHKPPLVFLGLVYNMCFFSPELPYWEQFTSMEQLWLAFYYKEKYDKIWVNDEWVEDGR